MSSGMHNYMPLTDSQTKVNQPIIAYQPDALKHAVLLPSMWLPYFPYQNYQHSPAQVEPSPPHVVTDTKKPLKKLKPKPSRDDTSKPYQKALVSNLHPPSYYSPLRTDYGSEECHMKRIVLRSFKLSKKSECKLCSIGIDSEEEYWNHYKKHLTIAKALQCPQCKFATTGCFRKWVQHLKTQHHLGGFRDEACYCPVKCEYVEHPNVCTYKCIYCNLSTSNSEFLKKHLLACRHKSDLILNQFVTNIQSKIKGKLVEGTIQYELSGDVLKAMIYRPVPSISSSTETIRNR